MANRLQQGDPNANNSKTPWNEGLYVWHNPFFSTILADTHALLEAAQALRFRVYCLERGFENPAEHPDGLEKDSYDARSVHGVLFHKPTRRAIGTVRAILPKASHDFPVAKLLQANSLDLSDYLVLSQTIEISRFAISRDLRRVKPDHADDPLSLEPGDSGQGASLLFLSLLQFVLRESIRHNVRFWTAVMEPKLLRLLARMGICYTPIGPLVEYHGIRQPCYCYLPDMLEKVRRLQPQCWKALTDGGALHDQLRNNIEKLAVA